MNTVQNIFRTSLTLKLTYNKHCRVVLVLGLTRYSARHGFVSHGTSLAESSIALDSQGIEHPRAKTFASMKV